MKIPAKEFLRKYPNAIRKSNSDEITRVIYGLYEMRDNKRLTEKNYKRILSQDDRYEEWENEREEWVNHNKEYGYMQGYEEPEYKPGFIEDLLEVIQGDISYGHLFNLLTNDKLITQEEIGSAIRNQEKTAIAEENITTGKCYKETPPFEKLLNCDDGIKLGLIEFLKQTFVGKGEKGRLFAIMVCALEKEELITYTNKSSLHRSITECFGNIGVKRGFEKYLNKKISLKLSETHYTSELLHIEIDEYANRISRKVSELKSSQ